MSHAASNIAPGSLCQLQDVLKERIRQEYDRQVAVGNCWKVVASFAQLAKDYNVDVKQLRQCWQFLECGAPPVELAGNARARRLTRLEEFTTGTLTGGGCAARVQSSSSCCSNAGSLNVAVAMLPSGPLPHFSGSYPPLSRPPPPLPPAPHLIPTHPYPPLPSSMSNSNAICGTRFNNGVAFTSPPWPPPVPPPQPHPPFLMVPPAVSPAPLTLMAPSPATAAPPPAAPPPQAAPTSAPLPPPLPPAPTAGAQDWSSFRIYIEEGALPDVGLPFDAEIAGALAKHQSYTSMLSTDMWDTLRTEWGIGENTHGLLASAWRPIATVLRVCTDASLVSISAEQQQNARRVASLFIAFIVAFADAELLCINLKLTRADRVRRAKQSRQEALRLENGGPELLPVIGGCFILVEQHGNPLLLRLAASYHALLGLQCKSGCIGAQLMDSVRVQKLKRAAAGSKERAKSGEAGRKERKESLPPFPSFICSGKGQSHRMCNEAAIISLALGAFTRVTRELFTAESAAEGQVPLHEWSSWDAKKALLHLMSASELSLGAAALVTLLMLSKYARSSPLSHTSLACLYSVYNYKKGGRPWWRERNDAHLLQFGAYLDIMCFGSPDHDGIETLQAALGFDVASTAGIAMEVVALEAGRPRNVASVFGRLLRLLPQRCRLHLDANGDWYEALLAVAAGWIQPSTNPHLLHQKRRAGVFPTDRVGVVQLARTASGHQKTADREEESGLWQYCILAAQLAQLVPIQGRRSLMEMERMAEIPKNFQLVAVELRCSQELW